MVIIFKMFFFTPETLYLSRFKFKMYLFVSVCFPYYIFETTQPIWIRSSIIAKAIYEEGLSL